MACTTSVEDWLRSLGLLTYTEAFIDNGYDDLDICKQIGDEDLDAIGVINSKDRRDILNSVKLLRDKGVNAVYFQLESEETPKHMNVWPSADREKYRREDLINKLKQLLVEDNCVLPENKPNAERDPLDDLAQYYADQLYTYVQDVKEVLEYLRDGESNEGANTLPHSPKLPEKKKQVQNEKLVKDSRLSKSLNSIDSASVKGKTPKSPKHGIRGLFGVKKNKNYVQQPPLIKGPMETAIGLANQVKMSDEDRKSLMLQVKHGDITQDEALSNFLWYEAAHTPIGNEKDKSLESKSKKKKGGIFNRGSFKRHSSGNSCEVLASDINVGEMERMELMRKIKSKEISNEEAWECLRRFGNKRDSKASKSPKLRRRGSKSPKERISASSFHIGPKFYTAINSDISQSTSNIPSRTGLMDSSPDSTPALQRKLESGHSNNSSSEQLGSNGSIDAVDPKSNYSQPTNNAAPPVSKRTPSPLAHNDLRRTVSAREANGQKENKELKRRSTVSSSDPNINRSLPPKPPRSSSSDSPPPIAQHLPSHPPIPPKKPPKLPPNKPTLAQLSNHQRSLENKNEDERPKLPDKPVLPAKPVLRPRPPKLKPYYNVTIPPKSPDHEHLEEDEEDLKELLVNGISSKGEVTSNEIVGGSKRKPSLPPGRPSPLTRVSSHKPSGHNLLEMIEERLKEEEIDLVQQPYTVEDGEWGVPMNLVERYSCELNSTMREVTKEMDHIRIEKLNQANKVAAPCDLSNLRFVLDVVGKLSSMTDWLTSLGLPMYIENLMEAGYDDINEIPYLNEEHLEHASITKPDHIYRLTRSLENMTPLDSSMTEPPVGD